MASWLARAFDLFRTPRPAPATTSISNELDVVSTFVAGRPLAPEDFDPRKLVDEGYRRNVIVYVCVNEIASSAASPKMILRDRRTQEHVEDHPLLDLIARPAPGLSWYDLMERVLVHQQTSGAAYIHKGRTAARQVVELRPARPDRIQPVPDRQGNVLFYEYRIDGTAPQRIETEDLAALLLPDPLNDFHGLAPLSVAAIYGDIDNAAALYLRDFFANGAMPMGLLKFKQPAVRREDRLRVQAEWAEQYGGGDITPQRRGRWHNVGVLGGDVEYQPLGSEPAQLRLDAVWGLTESRLCATFGVPPSIVQAKIGLQYNTYSNAESARRSFWTETLVPIYRRLSDALTRTIVAEFDADLELVFDVNAIPELQEDLNARSDRATKLFLGGLASFNESRKLAELGEAPVDFYAFPGSVKMVAREEVESGSYFEAPEPAPEPPPVAPPLPQVVDLVRAWRPEPPERDGLDPVTLRRDTRFNASVGESVAIVPERQAARPFVLLGLRQSPQESEDAIAAGTKRLSDGYTAAVREAVEASDLDALSAALAAKDWRAAERAVATKVFARAYGETFREHMRATLDAAHARHLHHHGADRETHGPLSDARRAEKKWRDRIESRVKQEVKRLDKEARDVVRSEILKVVNGDALAVDAKSIVGHIGLSARQEATVERQRQRLLAERSAKAKGRAISNAELNAIQKDLDHLRVKLLSERASTIAEFETRMAEGLGQQAAWERMLADGTLPGGRRHWRRLWVAADDERTCGVCMDLDGTETTLDGTFGEEDFYAPPEPHPNCRCRLTLVEAGEE
jgi:HK97 family phage portal protein